MTWRPADTTNLRTDSMSYTITTQLHCNMYAPIFFEEADVEYNYVGNILVMEVLSLVYDF